MKENSTKIILGIIIIALVVIGIKSFSSVPTTEAKLSTLDKIERTGEVDACYIELAPTVIKDAKTGELSGVLIDMADYMFDSMGDVKVNWQSSSWGTFPADLNSQRCDLVVAAAFVTIPRARTIAYSRPIAYTGNSAVVAKGSGLENVKSMSEFDKEGITIAVLNGEQGHEYVKQHFKNAEIKVIQGTDDTLPLVEVLSGRADVGLHESVVVSRFVAQHPNDLVDVFADNPYNPVQIAWAMRSDDMAWVNFVSTAINSMETTGKIDEYEQKYDMYWFRDKKELTLPQVS